ncbi:hypothetical protein FDJ25_gp091 [Vibrio phage Aphrodite1]|uniref:Uncharacterized protein n=1 Tax=Vibrio phage Aphrodite1 TaxID=2070057 RepID=A0A2I7QHR5_9CAUD|nr:hypothetical protein FDJ25_gp091 [Vibrio phage Aphrodite1]AUR80937.1 hypothetical protein Aphrodite1_0112 [Vibrio phage Aphrodite1]
MSEESPEIKRPKLRETHTAENTTMKEGHTPSVLGTMDKLPEGEDPSLNILLGTGKDNFYNILTLSMAWAQYQAAVSEGRASKAEITRHKKNYTDLAEKHYPDMTEEEIEEMMSHFLSFHRNLVELPYFRHKSMRERPWENLSEIADGKVEADVVPRYPGIKNEAMALSERMQRSSQRKSRTPNGYDVLFRDSFIQVRLEPSSIIELGRLIDRINKEIHGYVREYNGNSMTLIRAAIYRVFWNYISEKIVSHSVSDVDDPRDLSRYIKLSDIRALFIELMTELAEDGLPVQLYCNQDQCDWTGYVKADPALLLWHDKSVLSGDQAAALGNLKNFTTKFKAEEVLELQKQFQFLSNDDIMFHEDTHKLRLEQPSLSEYFLAYDTFMEYIEPSIRELRTSTLDDKTFDEKLGVLIDTVRGLEYLHWASELTIFPEPGADEEPEVFTRSENPVEFFNGLLPIINNSDDATTKLIRWCVENGPEMSSVVTGMSNATCPKCGKDTNGGHTSHGITPFDPFMGFFILTRQTISDLSVKRGIVSVNTL